MDSSVAMDDDRNFARSTCRYNSFGTKLCLFAMPAYVHNLSTTIRKDDAV